MLNVFLTVDTEIWPYSPGWPVKPLPAGKVDYAQEFDAYITGRTPKGDFGLPYQMSVLERHGLKAVYFVEALFASVAGIDTLARIVSLVQDRGNEVQLHIHTEWLGEITAPDLPAQFRQNIRQYTEDEQAQIIARASANLRAAGARNLCAYRAGNFGANFDTLRALARNGIRYDSSHNACFLGAECDMPTDAPLLQQTLIEGVYEYPVSIFSDYPGHLRHAQLCACSFQEMKSVLLQAWREGWDSFVIVWHGFELIRHVREPGRQTPDWINIRRLEKLSAFLAAHPDKFRSAVFSGIDERTPAHSRAQPVRSLRSLPWHTAWRYAEQMASRLL